MLKQHLSLLFNHRFLNNNKKRGLRLFTKSAVCLRIHTLYLNEKSKFNFFLVNLETCPVKRLIDYDYFHFKNGKN